MSYSQQKHIINKLQVDVATQNPSTAFDLKDHLDTFLKNEIFPYLESYFASLEEELQDQIIQIPYLSVDVNTSSALNYNELKEDVKRALVKNIEELTKKAHPHNEEATLLTTAKSMENQFFHFLEKGTLTWWNHSEDLFEVSDEDFETLITSESFTRVIKKKLMKKVVKQRIIQQLSDQQLKRVWEVLLEEGSLVSIASEAIAIFPKVSTEMRQVVWNCLIDFAIQNDLETLVSRLLFSLAEEVAEIPSKNHALKESQLQAKTASQELVLNLLVEFPENDRVNTAVAIIQKQLSTQSNSIAQNQETKAKEHALENTKTVEKKLQTDSSEIEKISDTSTVKLEKSLNELDTVEETTYKDIDTSGRTSQKTQQESVKKEETLSKTTSEQLQEDTFEPLKQSEVEDTIEGRGVAQDSIVSEEIQIENTTEKSEISTDSKTNSELISKEQVETEKSKELSKEIQKTETFSKSKLGESQENTPLKKDEAVKSNEVEETADSDKTISHVENQQEKISAEEEQKHPQDVESFSDFSTQQNTEKATSEITEEKTVSSDMATVNEPQKETVSGDSNEDATIHRNSENLAEESTENTSNIDVLKEKEVRSKNAVEDEEQEIGSSEELSESLHALVDKQDQKLFKELHKSQLENPIQMEERGEYQISNAGLMMLHPYIEHLFANCNLLNEDKTINNPDVAVHLLHYLATKKEQQFESNMLFEKILCGLHTSAAIRRNIVLSEEQKNNAEELLKVVLEHWGVLKNSSPDLLRNEFIQRLGIINFKEENPKIRVERKVQDILLDKLPWGIGICRLPWLDHLLFTDW